MLKKIRSWYLKHFRFNVWWQEYCEEHYCKDCKDRTPLCYIDYYDGHCWSAPILKEEAQKRNKKQVTFCYCQTCGNELVSTKSFVNDDDGIVTYKCSFCGTVSKFDFYAPAPILLEINNKEVL